MKDPFRTWAERYDRETGELPPRHRSAAQRAQLLFSARRRSQTSRRRRGWYTAWATAAAVSVTAWLVFGSPSTFFEETENTRILLGVHPVEAGASIVAESEEKLLRFPEGSRVIWEKGTTGSLSKITESAVELSLAEGTLALDVEKKAGRQWVVSAGNFRVHVIGTAFTVSRDKETESFSVRVTRGKVRVRGPELENDGVFLGRGEVFRWRPAPVESRPETWTQTELPAEAREPNVAAPATPPPELARAPKGKMAESWQSLAHSGKYELAVETAQSQGISQVLSAASAEDRVLLGNAARYSGRIDLSRRAYGAAREKPSGSATLAAYYMAKVALDSNGDQGQAIKWLRTYLTEAPSGDLAASARARLMNLLSATGRTAEAQKVARDYLNLHPGGPQTQVAKRLLARP